MKSAGKTCVIISGGQYSPIGRIEETDYVIACDKGYEYAIREGIEPDMIIGDFDSCSDMARAMIEHEEQKVKVERYPSEKDDTDTMLAIKHALDLDYKRIRILCGLGGRIDHFYANMQSLVYAAKRGVLCSIEDEENCIYAMGAGCIELPRRKGWSVSLFAGTSHCAGITTSGLKYSLDNGMLTNDFPLGISNEWEAECATVEVKEGILLVIMSKKVD